MAAYLNLQRSASDLRLAFERLGVKVQGILFGRLGVGSWKLTCAAGNPSKWSAGPCYVLLYIRSG